MEKKINFIIVTILLWSSLLNAKKDIYNFTDEEMRYIKEHPVLLAHNEHNWPPFNFIDDDTAMGYSVDYIKLLASKIGLEVKFISGYTWNEYVNMLQTPQLDLIINISKNEQRSKTMSFTDVFLSVKNAIYTNKKNGKTFEDINHLQGYTIAMTKGFYAQRFLEKNYPKIKQVLVDNQLEALKLLSKGKVDATIGKKVVMDFIIDKHNIENVKVTKYINDPRIISHMRIGSSKDDKVLSDILTKVQLFITKEEKSQLDFKWLGLSISKTEDILLSEKEKNYLKQKKLLKICVQSDDMPLEGVSENKHVGLFSDYVKKIAEKIDIMTFHISSNSYKDGLEKLHNNQCDIASGMFHSKDSDSVTNIYKYLDSDILIASKPKEIYIDDLSKYTDKVFVMEKDFLFYDVIKTKYPNIQIVLVTSIEDGLSLIEKGEAFAFIGDGIRLSYQIRKNYFGRVSVVGSISSRFSFNLISKKENDILNGILKKATKDITNLDRATIEDRWLQFNNYSLIDVDLIVKILVVFLLIIIVFIFYFNKQKKLKNKIDKLNKILRIKIAKEVKLNKEKDITIYNQSKLISMGELINNIAHQWRQPLSEINSVIMCLDTEFHSNTMSKKSLEHHLEKIEQLTEHMSSTIENFQDFFSNDKEKTKFFISSNIKKVLSLFENSFEKHHIKINTIIIDDLQLETYEGELLQVLIILLQNSKDAFVEHNIQNARVTLSVQKIKNKLSICVHDNAGGIKSDIIGKIFESHFSTKNRGYGLGLGLCLAKQIIEKSILGTMEVKSDKDTTLFTISIPL